MACACTTLRKASRAVTRLYDEAMAQTGVSIAQFALLRAIARGEPLPLARLADQQVMDRTTLYRALGPLERHGWIATKNSDGRAKAVRLTDAGRQVMADATHVWERAQAGLIGKVGSNEWQGLAASLARVVTASQERPA